ncbi:hypothetical protein LUD75_07890 [Epilithonimonas sp. JDS]|uniref:hypothetical protein n=1 Tax=Epilithonimonas sp. JDS TaxID=2902797 RepID=UPI001E3BCDAE|nr:hypothetical protein [Epilithonimonas sp. JDS]MCD9854624.1 hypothetical protein [Epilithonimonas sp. JDS]
MKTVKSVLENAENTLYTAELGLKMYQDSSSSKDKMAGLRNLIVFGRAVTNVLQNLKNLVVNFEGWYNPKVEEMGKDAILKHFYQMRSEVLKEGDIKFASSVQFNNFNSMEFEKKIESIRPPNAKSFFIGDELGGSGWNIENEDGTIEKFYININEHLDVELNYKIELYNNKLDLPTKDIPEAGIYYIEYLKNLLNEAKNTFL